MRNLKELMTPICSGTLYFITIILIYFKEKISDDSLMFYFLFTFQIIYYIILIFLFKKNNLNKVLLSISIMLSIICIIFYVAYIRFKNYGH